MFARLHYHIAIFVDHLETNDLEMIFPRIDRFHAIRAFDFDLDSTWGADRACSQRCDRRRTIKSLVTPVPRRTSMGGI